MTSGFSEEVGRLYFNKFLGHLHQSPDENAPSLTTIQCAYAVKVLKRKKEIEGWVFAQVGEDKGFIETKFLEATRPECFQEKYSRFYLEVGLDITQMYYWGRLYDQYDTGKTQIK